jgi:hypothetical protein
VKKLIFLVAAGLVCSGAWANAADGNAVNDAMNRLSAAMIAGDAQKMKELTADTLTYGIRPRSSTRSPAARRATGAST